MIHFNLKPLLTSILVCLILAGQAVAQKKDLTPGDYARWQIPGFSVLSPDGKWFACQITPVEGDGWISVKQVGADTEHQFMYASRPAFSKNNRWFAIAIGVSEKEDKKLKKDKKPVKYKVGIMNLATAAVDTLRYVESFVFSEDGRFLAMKKYKVGDEETESADLVVRDLETGTNQNIGNVSEFGFSEEGAWLAVVIDASEKLGNGVQLRDLVNGTIRILESDEETFSGLKWNEDGMDLAFLKERENKVYEDPDHLIYAFKQVGGKMTRQMYDSETDASFPAGYRVAAEGALRWSEDGGTVFFGLKKWEPKETEPEKPEESEKTSADNKEDGKKEEADKELTAEDRDADLDPPGVDVWHWKDPRVQPRQQVQADRDREFTFLAAWRLKENTFTQLADSTIRNVTLSGDQKHAVGYDRTPYEPSFREQWNDVYVMDVRTGERQKILDRFENTSVSPDGKYVLYFKENNWWTYDLTRDSHANLTEGIATRFNNYRRITGRESDGPFGSGQWAEKDEWVLLYDEYDVYRVRPDDGKHERLTQGAEDRIRYRQVRLDLEEDTLDLKGPIYFRAYGDVTKLSGYYRFEKGNRLSRLLYEPLQIDRLLKAEDADVFVYRTQKADRSPNFYRVDSGFNAPVQLTDTNPQQEEYHWGNTELVSFTNDNGVELQGRLLYPANFQQGKQYPMIVYIYELRSQTLHNYSTPARTSAYNQRRFSAEGYFVFEPDIVYRLRDPGMSAVECVVPAVKEVLKTGMIDESRIGLTGHSWGAYQTSFIITQTDLFKAAVAGAPLTNMISMYNSVYWNSGSTDARIFEVSQGRFPKPYWEDWDKFVQNSPIFNAQHTDTPLLVAFGDKDGAVDFNQGVEMYNTMRRMEKPFIMLVYEGENHGLRKKENQLDYATRAHDWFKHFLLDEPPAPWIQEGIPFLQKGLEKKKQREARKNKPTM
jgi:dipeptidyl aminopeptidase/acylaminoacyl peptidase